MCGVLWHVSPALSSELVLAGIEAAMQTTPPSALLVPASPTR